MACFLQNGDDTKITIPRIQETEKCTLYEIQVEIGDIHWTVLHRYNDFVQLHEVLVTEHGVAKDLLPPKKVIGNKERSFIEKRRGGLENYLMMVVRYLQKTMPKELVVFLSFPEYDILFLLQNMAVQFFLQGESLLMRSRGHTFNTLQLYAISERLKQPCPSTEQQDQRQDFSHVLDYCSQIIELIVEGSEAPVKKSNIVPNKLPYEFSSFKSVEKLILVKTNYEMMYDLGNFRNTLKSFEIHNTDLHHLTQLLLCDQLHKDIIDGTIAFKSVTNANFSFNQLQEIDRSITLLPNLEILNLESNQIKEIQNLTSLTKLKHLNLSANLFQNINNLELKLCKIVSLDLSQNYLTSLAGFSKLYSLETLDVKSNRITDVAEVKHISKLPCLENLILTGNPVSIVVDYRVKVLELFGGRALEICLDNEKSNQKELDKVAILQAIRLAKEGRSQKT